MTDRIHVVAFPFDLYGNAGTGAGAVLLAEVVREIVDDTDRETRATRADAYRDRIDVTEFDFETPKAVAEWRATGTKAIRKCLKENRFTLWLGGNHLSVLPVYESLGPDDLVIQFDAHLDLFDLHDTTEHLSHGNFLRHASSLPTLVNVGHRDLLIPEKSIGKYYRETIPAIAVQADPASVCNRLRKYVAAAKRVWFDVDADVFDPAFCPAVHQRTPFGLPPLAVLNLVDAIWSEKVIGASVCEFDPGRDVEELSLQLLGWWVEWLCLNAAER